MTKAERQQMIENQKMIDEMNAGTPKDSNTDVHSQITTAMDAFSAAEEELKRKESVRKKITGR
jgi:hypothetical protein